MIVGIDDESTAIVTNAMSELGGGTLAIDGSRRLFGSVKIDVAGCMSSAPREEVRNASLHLDRAVMEQLGSDMAAPFMVASFIGLVGVPDLGLAEMGLVVGESGRKC